MEINSQLFQKPVSVLQFSAGKGGIFTFSWASALVIFQGMALEVIPV